MFESNRPRHIVNGLSGRDDQTFCQFNPAGDYVLMGNKPGARFEASREMKWTELRDTGEFFERQPTREARLDVLVRGIPLGWRDSRTIRPSARLIF